MVESQVVDDLHTIYLGVVKRMVHYIVDKMVLGKYEKFDLIDEELNRKKGITEISAIKSFSMISD